MGKEQYHKKMVSSFRSNILSGQGNELEINSYQAFQPSSHWSTPQEGKTILEPTRKMRGMNMVTLFTCKEQESD